MKQLLVKGKAGSGKTKNILFKEVEKIIKNNENILFVDSKQEYYNNYSQKLKDTGYNIITINLKDPIHSHSYNPFTLPYLYFKNGNKDRAYELINNFAKSIFKDGKNTSDPFWENTACDLFTGLSIILFNEADEDTINFGSLNSSLKCLDDTMQNYLNTLNPNDPIYVCTSGTAFSPSETKASIISVFRQKLTTFCLRENLMKLLAKTDFDFGNFKTQKTAIFILTREDSKTVNTIANVLIEQIFNVALNEQTKFNFILDNIESMPFMYFLNTMLDTYNDNVITYIATRDEDNLKEIYGSKTFMNTDKIIDSKNVPNDIKEETNSPIELPTLKSVPKYFDMKAKLEEVLK